MQTIDGAAVVSASDLVGFLACEHLTNLERAALANLVNRPDRQDAELDMIAKRGTEHELRYLEFLRDAQRRTVSEISSEAGATETRGDGLRRAAAETIDAMRRGDEVIYQATFFDGRWLGFADFLVRVDR
ncbi:MAG: recombinase B, partial [Chloroflexi bacterium]|nr:recombinase B [Chloroflexota bacterium]